MVRSFKPLRSNIGKGRLLRSDNSTHAQFTRSIRAQMAAVTDNYKNFVNHLDESGIEILKNALTPAFEESLELVPKDTSALSDSGYLESRKLRNRSVVEIGYARGGNPHYGVFVHENLEVFHEPPTQAKFLEQPLAERSDEIRQTILSQYKEASGT